MLVLTRKVNEGILIGEDIFIRVLSINGNRVKLGIQAPGQTNVLREEVVDIQDIDPNLVAIINQQQTVPFKIAG